jgi:hypothetical protein
MSTFGAESSASPAGQEGYSYLTECINQMVLGRRRFVMSEVPLYSQVDVLGAWYKSVNFAAETSPGEPPDLPARMMVLVT